MASYRDGEPVVMRRETGISFGFYRDGPFFHEDGRALHLIEPDWGGRGGQRGFRVPLVDGEFEPIGNLRFYADGCGRVYELVRHGDELASVVIAETSEHSPKIAALLQAEHERELEEQRQSDRRELEAAIGAGAVERATADVWDIGRSK